MIDMSTKHATRIYVMIASAARVAVVFRRGPSKLVLLLRWDMAADTFEAGQWFKGRIYERRCDISPSGKYLVYFAGNQKPPYYRWTAISKPPYLTALTLWPGIDCTGGFFKSDSSLCLEHWWPANGLGLRSSVPKGFEIVPFDDFSGRGQYGFILKQRMKRDGWIHVQEGVAHTSEPTLEEMQKLGAQLKNLMTEPGPNLDTKKALKLLKTREQVSHMRTVFPPVDIWQRNTSRYCLEMRTLGLGETKGPQVVTEYRVSAGEGGVVLELGRADWADWDSNGDLLYAKAGAIYRLPEADIGKAEAIKLIDLSQEKFRPLEAPAEYQTW